MNAIEAVVLPLKTDAIERAEQDALALVERVRKELEAADYDLNICAPYPQSFNMGRMEFQTKLSKYKLFGFLTKWRKSSYGMREPHYADMNDEKIVAFVKNAKEMAAQQYDAFVAKLVAKIGEVSSAELTGNHVWGYSHLFVVLPDGEKQIWKTQQIVNMSKLGKLFNQWPTRKVKKV